MHLVRIGHVLDQLRILICLGHQQASLVHGWQRIKNVHVYSLLGLSTHEKCKMLPNCDKVLSSASEPSVA